MELLLLRLPNDLELMARWFAEDGEAEDTLNHCLTYRRAYRHLLPNAQVPPLPQNTSVYPHGASAHCALACGAHAPEHAAPAEAYEAYLQPDPYLQAEAYPQAEAYQPPEPVMQQAPYLPQPEPMMQQQPQEPAMQPDLYLQAEPYQPPEPVMPMPVMPQPEPMMQQAPPYMPPPEPVMQQTPYQPQPEPVMQQAPYQQPEPVMQQQPAAAWEPAPPMQPDYSHYAPTMNDMENLEAAGEAEKSLGKKAIGIVSKTTTIFVIALMAVSIVVFLLPRIFGMELRAVVSPSMEPVHPVGSVVVIRPRPFEQIEVFDDITFVRDMHGTIVTHRVIARNAADRTLTTQGLTNNAPDAPVSYENVIGVVWFSVPVVGHAFIWLEPTVHKVIIAIVIVAIWLALFLVEKAVSTKKTIEPEVTSAIYS